MKRMLAAFLIGTLALLQPAAAQQQQYEPSVAGMQALMADVGRWTQEYQALMGEASEPLININVFVEALDRFVAGEVTADRAAADIEDWRSRAIVTFRESRAAAQAFRAPPSLSILGPDGAALEHALNVSRDTALPTIHEFERVVNATADLGITALRDPEKGYEARERAMFQAAIQLVRVDRGRIDVAVASLPDRHPNQAIMAATQHYYDTLVAVPAFALEELEGGGDRAALVASLRQSARNMRAELNRSSMLTQQTLTQMRAMQGGEAVAMVRTIVQTLETFPDSIRAYQGLVTGIEQAANALERGADVRDVWADQETSDAPHLTEIDRLERLRANMIANNGGTL